MVFGRQRKGTFGCPQQKLFCMSRANSLRSKKLKCRMVTKARLLGDMAGMYNVAPYQGTL